MKFFDKLGKLEQGIGRTVGFSKGFGTFEKADVANRVRIMMDDESYVDGSGRTMAPNIYTLRFAPVDFPRVREWGNPFAVELCDLAISHARAQGYTLIGAVRVTFNVLDSLAEGEFEVVATFEPFSVPDAPASPTLRGAANYAPVRPRASRNPPPSLSPRSRFSRRSRWRSRTLVSRASRVAARVGTPRRAPTVPRRPRPLPPRRLPVFSWRSTGACTRLAACPSRWAAVRSLTCAWTIRASPVVTCSCRRITAPSLPPTWGPRTAPSSTALHFALPWC